MLRASAASSRSAWLSTMTITSRTGERTQVAPAAHVGVLCGSTTQTIRAASAIPA